METEYCGEETVDERETLGYNKKVAASDGQEYRISEAEEKDLKHIIENSCMRCNRLIPKNEIKVVPPRCVQEQDRYVLSGFVSRRVLCVACYDKMVSSTRERIKARYRGARNAIRAGGVGAVRTLLGTSL
jgi:hypothetical protein